MPKPLKKNQAISEGTENRKLTSLPGLDRREFLSRAGKAALACGLFSAMPGCLAEDSVDDYRIDRIFLITIDTLRADHVGCYGYPRETTPFIDKMARKGILFKRAMASIASTSPSHATIFTSLYPAQHRVLKNEVILHDAFYTMGHDLMEKGFSSAAFVSTTGHFQGLEPSFSVLDRPDPQEYRRYRQATQTIDAAIEWLGSAAKLKDKSFVWVHLFDPHKPYLPGKDLLDLFRHDSQMRRDFLTEYYINQHKVEMPYWEFRARKRNKGRTGMYYMFLNHDLYDAEIRYADSELERLFNYACDKDLKKNSLWIVTSDHGEGLGVHGWRGHGKNIYNEQLHVPLLFFFPERPLNAKVVNDLVDHADLRPTVSELLGEDTIRQVLPIQGHSLCPFFKNNSGSYPNKMAIAQRRIYDAPSPNKHNAFDRNYEPGDKFAIQSQTQKYILWTQGSDEFFFLEDDPYEQDNLLKTQRHAARPLKKHLISKLNQFETGIQGAGRETDSREALKNLKDLGYIE